MSDNSSLSHLLGFIFHVHVQHRGGVSLTEHINSSNYHQHIIIITYCCQVMVKRNEGLAAYGERSYVYVCVLGFSLYFFAVISS